MPLVYGYVLLGDDRLQSEFDALRGQIEQHCRETLSHLAWGGLYLDAPTETFCSVERRRAGGELNLRVAAGDCVVVARIKDVLDSPDYMRVVNNWRRRGATFVALDIGAELSEEETAELWRVSSALSAWAAEKSRKRAARAMKTKRDTGCVLNQAVPLGFRLVGPRGRRREVPDPEERRVMALIHRLHTEEKLSFYKIAVKLWQDHVTTRRGGEWSEERVRRAFKAECRLREHEQQRDGQGPAGPQP